MFVLALIPLNTNAQTVKYRLVKIVDRNTGAEFQPNVDVRFITFTDYNKSQFSFTNQNGQLINDNYSSWSYMNTQLQGGTTVYNNGLGGSISTGGTTVPINKRVFSYTNTQNGLKVYTCKRPIYSISDNRLLCYATDYIYFNEDMSRFNVYSGGRSRDNGITPPNGWDNTITLFDNINHIYVYERVENSPSPNGGLY